MTRTKNTLLDVDGVLVSRRARMRGGDGFLERLRVRGAECLVLTNNPLHAPGDLAHRLKTVGLDIPAECIVGSVADIEP